MVQVYPEPSINSLWILRAPQQSDDYVLPISKIPECIETLLKARIITIADAETLMTRANYKKFLIIPREVELLL